MKLLGNLGISGIFLLYVLCWSDLSQSLTIPPFRASDARPALGPNPDDKAPPPRIPPPPPLPSVVFPVVLPIVRISPTMLGALKCSDTEFQCSNQQHCIPSRWKCDGEHDCSDGSDEDPQMCKAVQGSCIESDFECSRTLCIPLAWVCDDSPDCPDSRDERNCNATCTSSEFTCKNGRCIVSHWRCDGNNDCTDNSDEENCPPRTCTPGKDFMCKNDSSCILANWHCDGEYDCADGSDEKGCSPDSMNITSRCGKLEFECADKITCIHSSWVCDADVDCPDGADEKDCDRPKCRSDQFECRTNGDCIPGHLQCSGMPECNDGSDEEHCATSTPCDPLTHFSCQTSGLCVSLDKICDQRNDCGDWGDEPRDRCGVNECATENGGCAEICVDTPIGHYCECKAGFKLVGNSTCEDINECETPGTCSQLCVNEKGTFKCECVEGYLRDPKDHTRCKAVEGHASLLFALRRDIRKISLDHLKMTLIVEKTRSATALDYMFRTGMIFWTDTHEGKIYKAPIDEGSAKSVVVEEGLSNADGLAIDWVYNHIYWTDSGKKDIAVAELDGKMRRTLIKDGLVEPRAIAVNPVDGWMYWTDWGVTPGRIERAGMDGSRREIIVSTGLKWPNGLTLDLVQERVYWVDAKMNSISSVNYDGSDRRLVLQSHSALAHPFSITTFEDWVYWTDWANETIFKANKFTGKELSAIIPPNTVKHVMSVHVYHAYRQPDGENHCTPLNGRCSHLCLPAPKVNERSPLISCGCPDGLVLTNDGQNCAPDPAFNLHHLLHRMQDALPDDSMMKAELNRTLFPVIGGGKRISKPGSNRGQNNVQRGTESGMDQGDQYSHVSSSSEPDTNTIAGIVIGILSALLVLVILVVLVLYRHFFVKGSDTMNFDNPVYRKTTTEDRISIEKNRYNKSLNNGGGHGGFNNSTSSSITISDEAEEPLTRRESQPIAIQQSSSSQSRLGHRGQCQVQPMLSQQEEASEYV
ncbi:low-density lipoprotein receptor isoform X2 [Folsomia candida]|uniref:low-density lipoprotein receptor isoform X2 n=1 Tax=Folsomia candida TaxID=158441 RepID=UPI001604D92D|nr:low-density lipoprotein receptor isoform X2 [Folsomia candida]